MYLEMLQHSNTFIFPTTDHYQKNCRISKSASRKTERSNERIVCLISKMNQINLRKFGYKVSADNFSRAMAVCKAYDFYGGKPLLDHLKYLKTYWKKNAEHNKTNAWWYVDALATDISMIESLMPRPPPPRPAVFVYDVTADAATRKDAIEKGIDIFGYRVVYNHLRLIQACVAGTPLSSHVTADMLVCAEVASKLL
jgi:hypothetical protein